MVWVRACCSGSPSSALGVWYTHPYEDDDDDDDGDDDHHHHHHQFKHLNVSLVGRRVSSAHLAGSDYRFIDQ